MIIDGKAIALDIRDTLLAEIRMRKESDMPTLYIIVAGENAATKSFVALKKKYAAELGIPVRERVFAAQSTTTEVLLGAIQEIVASGMRGGIVVQLPLPPYVDTKAVLDAIPLRYDVDVLSEKAVRLFEGGESPVLPPVIGAFREILERHSVFLRGKRVAILGKGRLVGAPAATWFRRRGADVHVVDSKTPDVAAETRAADIIVSGIGKPWFITPDMVKDGVILLDAGTSSLDELGTGKASGKVVGDAHPDTAEKCALFTPVPGGIGPLTVAVLFQNLLTLATDNKT